MATTSKGIYYPTATTAVAPLESVFADMASSIDTALPLSGTYPFSFTAAAGSSQSVSPTFGVTLGAAPQRIQLTVRGTGGFAATVTSSTTTGFTANVHRLSGTGTVTINLVWTVV